APVLGVAVDLDGHGHVVGPLQGEAVAGLRRDLTAVVGHLLEPVLGPHDEVAVPHPAPGLRAPFWAGPCAAAVLSVVAADDVPPIATASPAPPPSRATPTAAAAIFCLMST